MIKGSELQARHVGSMITQRTTSGGCGNEGNRKCNPNTWDEFGGYRDGCCTPEQRCQENEGDCSDDSDCFPGLVCGNRNCPKGVGFGDRADCCELYSGTFNPSKQANFDLSKL